MSAIIIPSEDAAFAALTAAQRIQLTKTASRTSTAVTPWSMIGDAGQPGAGVLAGTSTAAGVVPTDATQGFPTIDAFPGANRGYLAGVQFGNSVAGRLYIYDLLFKAGAYSFNSNVSLAAQPSFASRVPSGTDFRNLEVWVEAVTAFTGNPTITLGYQKEDNATGGRSTGAIAFGLAPTVGRLTRMPLQAGDEGISKLESVLCAVASVGTFNVLIMRRLWQGRITQIGAGDVHTSKQTGNPEVWADSALYMTTAPDLTATGFPEITMMIANIAA